jgi:hypothetical protein
MTDKLKVYSRSDNAEIIYKSYTPITARISQTHQHQLIDYPETFTILQA